MVKRGVSLVTVALALAVCSTAGGVSRPAYFPLADGNRWTLRDAQQRAVSTISVRRQGTGLVLQGFPGVSELRVRAAGQAVQAWDAAQRRWEPFLRFDARPGAKYAVDLARTTLWRSVLVTVASKSATVEDYEGRERRGAVRLTFRSRGKVVDAGIEELVFAPGVGPVRIVTQSIAGPRELLLATHTVRSL